MDDLCSKCNKPKISPEKRCDCRLEWQINKSFELSNKCYEVDNENEDLETKITELEQRLERCKPVVEFYGDIENWIMSTTETFSFVLPDDCEDIKIHLRDIRGGKRARELRKEMGWE